MYDKKKKKTIGAYEPAFSWNRQILCAKIRDTTDAISLLRVALCGKQDRARPQSRKEKHKGLKTGDTSLQLSKRRRPEEDAQAVAPHLDRERGRERGDAILECQPVTLELPR